MLLIIHTLDLARIASSVFLCHFQADVSELKQQMLDLHQQLLEQVGNNCVYTYARVCCRLDKFASYVSYLRASFIRVAHVHNPCQFIIIFM